MDRSVGMYVCMSGPLVSEGKGRDAMSVPWETCREVLGMFRAGGGGGGGGGERSLLSWENGRLNSDVDPAI